ncbi:MAG: pentapeptide repeat-containing protein [Cyanobacteria bacterium J06597_16]
MKAKELLRRYNKGERDFREVDLSGESLRGMNLAGIDLSGANLGRTNLHGTRFTAAKLVGAQLCESQTSSQERQLLWSTGISLMLNGPAAALLGIFVAFFLDFIILPSGDIIGSISGDLVFGTVGLASVLITFYFNYYAGTLRTLSVGAVIATYAVGVASIFAFLVTNVVIAESAVANASIIILAVAAAGATAVTVAVTTSVAGAVTAAMTGAVAGAYAYAVVITTAVVIAYFAVGEYSVRAIVADTADGSNEALIVRATTVIVLLVTGINCMVSHRALSDAAPYDQLIRSVAIASISLGGTQFNGADLTKANFSRATLKGADFDSAILHHTCFHLSQQLHLTQTGKTILANRTVLDLLVSLRPEPNTSYVGLNLKGAHLAHANLADLDLTETDLSGATLAGADLQRTTLTKVQALGTNFYQANLTAACVESWNLDSTTQLADALCEHVYLLRNQQERRPNSGNFKPGEFSELFEEVLNTIDLIFRDGMDWQAFMQTFQTIQVEHQGADLEIQSIEKKGNGVMVVRLNTHPDADKPVIHGAFKQEYELKLAAVEQEYKALLASKEQAIGQKKEIIELYRQKSADMTTIAQSLAQRPVTVDVKAVANSKTGDETIYIQGNVDGSVVRIGDGDDAPSA